MKAPAYAKVNLTLEVLGRRDDGYHALRSVVQPISLADELELTEADGNRIRLLGLQPRIKKLFTICALGSRMEIA